MESSFEQIRDEQKESWNLFSPGWKKYDEVTMNFMKPIADEMISLLRLKENDLVLDVAAGTGEPGLTIAKSLKNGKVIATDLSVGMLSVAEEKAKKQGLNNYVTMVSDVSELPFPDHKFDAITCRMGFMFFPDMRLATRELVRVLKPGGRMAISVWNVPEKNFWVTAIMNSIKKNLELPLPAPEAPGMFRCAKSGLMTGLFRESGLKNVSETEINGKFPAGTSEVYWNFMTEVGAPIVAALSHANAEMKEKIKREVFELIDLTFPDGHVNIDSSALVIFGEK